MEKPLGPQRWAGVIDSVGGTTLAAAAAQTMYRGSIASTGMHTSRTLLSRTIHRALSTLVLSAFKVLSISPYPALYHPSSHTLLNLILLSFTPGALCLPSSSSLSFLTLPTPPIPHPKRITFVHHGCHPHLFLFGRCRRRRPVGYDRLPLHLAGRAAAWRRLYFAMAS